MSPLVGDQSIEHEGHQMPASAIWSPAVIEDIQLKAQLGRYRLQGFSTHRRVPSFDDLTFVPCTLSRVPLEGYRERCETRTVLGSRYASKPIVRSPSRGCPTERCRGRRRWRWGRPPRGLVSRPPPVMAACSSTSARHRTSSSIRYSPAATAST